MLKKVSLSSTILLFSGILLISCSNDDDSVIPPMQENFALDFNADNNQRVEIPHSNTYDIGIGDFTIEAIVKTGPQTKSFPMIISKRGAEEFSGFFLSYYEADKIIIQLDGTNYIADTGSINLHDNVCRHIAAKRESGTVNVYIDGNLIGTVAQNNVKNISMDASVIIGSDEANDYVNNLDGLISEVRFWNIARSDSDIDLYKRGELPNTNENGLIGYWKLSEGEGQLINDFSSNQNEGMLGSDPMFADINDPAWTDNVCF